MYRSLLILLSLSAVSFAQVDTPTIGFVRYPGNTLHPVTGVAAAFIVGQPLFSGVNAASFGAAGGVVSVNGSLQITDPSGQVKAEDTGDPGAIVGIGKSLDTAIAWLPGSGTLTRYDGTKFIHAVLPSALPGSVTAIRVQGDNAELLVASEGAVSAITVSMANGNLLQQRFLSGVTAPAIYAGQRIFFLDQNVLVLQAADGTRQSIAMPPHHDGIQFQKMSEAWIHISDSQSDWALDLTGTTPRLFELPCAPTIGVQK